MGITGLTKLISDYAPGAIKEDDIKNYFGRRVAIDASMTLYQFVIAVRPDDLGQHTLTNDYGETTSHLQGLFYRTIRMVTNGIKPIYVFDGAPPDLKSKERKAMKKAAAEKLTKAEDDQDNEAIKRLNKQTARVTPEMNEDAKRLLALMGIPVIQAPCEAEAQCAELVKGNKAFGAATEDMDTLTCGVPTLLRHMTYSAARKSPILEISLSKVLSGLGLKMDEFIDLCILLGCDYADKIRGIGPKRALEQYKNIETIISNLDKKYEVPEHFPYEAIREYFRNPPVTPADQCEIKFKDPDVEGLVEFLVKEKGFNEERVRGGAAKIKSQLSQPTQGRLTSFFTVKKPAAEPPKKSVAKKAPVKGKKK